MRIAVTGAGGRLGQALQAALADAPFTGPSGPVGWNRARLDLDRPEAIGGLLDSDRVELVVHAAAWTDVDGCARDPALALRRNGDATGVIATECARRGIDLVYISTNEVFDGRRADGRGYQAGDLPDAVNAYGVSKLAGERAAAAALAGGQARLAIARTAWLFGPPGPDFPTRIIEAGLRAGAKGIALRVVRDEVGSPTYAPDLADGITELIGADVIEGVHHLVNSGAISRAGWARELVRQMGLEVRIEEIPATEWRRASAPPLWAVLAPTPLPSGVPMRPWEEALADYVAVLRRPDRARTAG